MARHAVFASVQVFPAQQRASAIPHGVQTAVPEPGSVPGGEAQVAAGSVHWPAARGPLGGQQMSPVAPHFTQTLFGEQASPVAQPARGSPPSTAQHLWSSSPQGPVTGPLSRDFGLPSAGSARDASDGTARELLPHPTSATKASPTRAIRSCWRKRIVRPQATSTVERKARAATAGVAGLDCNGDPFAW
jgi:hypothetical protein